MNTFALPMKDILHKPVGNTSFHYHHRNTFSDFNLPSNNINHIRPKSISFSIFGRPKWRKEYPDGGDHHEEQDIETNHNNPKKKLKLEVAQLIRRYMEMVKPFKVKRSNTELNRQPHSFTCDFLNSRSSLPVEMNRGGVKRGEFSAPASMRISPADSRKLLGSGSVSPAIGTASDSTMEELQAAIQAAIAHCKNSIAIEDKVQA